MKVLCKKRCIRATGLIFEKSKYYKVDEYEHTYDPITGIVDSYFIRTKKNYGSRFILDNSEKYKNPIFTDNRNFSEYFYTKKELRKEKLLKINQSQ